MNLVAGLGNPGNKYSKNRHNVGWLVLDELKQKISKSEILISSQTQIPDFQFQKKFHSQILKIDNLVLVKPQTMMNSSGKAVKNIVDHYKIKTPDLWVIHDDLDLRLGSYKIQLGKGPREHKGLLSIYDSLGTKGFWHVRVGVDNRQRMSKVPGLAKRSGAGKGHMSKVPSGERYVLLDFTSEELAEIDVVIAKIVKDLLTRLT